MSPERRKYYFNLPESLFMNHGHLHIQGVEDPLSDSTLRKLQKEKKELFNQIYPAQALFQASQEILGESYSVSKKLGEQTRMTLEVTRNAPDELRKQFPGHLWARADIGYPFDTESLFFGTDQFSAKEPTIVDFDLGSEVEIDLNGQTQEITDALRQIIEIAGHPI